MGLTAEELHTLLIFIIRLISKIAVRQVLLAEFEVVGSGFHVGFPLAEIQIEYVIDMRANRDLVSGVVAIKRVYVPLNHGVVDFFTFIQLPSVQAFLQFAGVKAVLVIFFLGSFSFFFWFAFGILARLIVFFRFLSEFAFGLVVLIHCFESLGFSALLQVFKLLL